MRKITPKKILDRIRAATPDIELPTLSKDVELPVFVVHNSSDEEDYFFIFDFEQFVESTRSGLFVRPKLTIWAGRTDFARSQFAKQFRESFAREFDIARAQLADQEVKTRGWFGFLRNSFSELRGRSLSEFLANLVLLVGLSTSQAVLSQILPAGWMSRKSDTSRLEDGIETTRSKVDAALRNVEIRQHPELYEHAFRNAPKGKNSELERDAWPLPGYVKAHLQDGESGSWW